MKRGDLVRVTKPVITESGFVLLAGKQGRVWNIVGPDFIIDFWLKTVIRVAADSKLIAPAE